MSDFNAFGNAIRRSVAALMKNATRLYVVNSDRDKIWETYLKSFPKGTDPIFRTKTEHDCGCCRHFIRAVGDVVAISKGKLTTIWDVEGLGKVYQPVADGMAAYVRSCEVKDIFLTRYAQAGQEKSVEVKDGKTITWEHFATTVPKQFICNDPETQMAKVRDSFNVLKRGVEELTPDSIETVIDLIDRKALYRGEEFKTQLLAFQALQKLLKGGDVLAIWENVDAPVARLRNTAIGTLLQDLSEGKDLEASVRAFEKKVAPENYKRPTALVTKAMIEDARKTVIELDLESALERRHARPEDVSVNNVLWVDGTAKGKFKGGIFDRLAQRTQHVSFDPKKTKPIGIDAFLALPHKTGMQLFLDNRLLSKFVSITAPVHSEVKQLFKWKNDFGWSYKGNVTDSLLRSQVAALGGRVDGVFRFSHTWNYDPTRPNKSLMDLHVFMPGSNGHRDGVHDGYPMGDRVGWNRRKDPRSGGVQDVDYDKEFVDSFVPVENITFPDLDKMPEGEYVMKIHNWRNRPGTVSGFRAEIEFGGEIFQYERREALANKEWVTVAKVKLKDGKFSIEHVMPCTSVSQDCWGLKTMTLVPVKSIILSPNHWDDNAVGNKHWFFILEGCKNPEPCRGLYNEYLHSRLEKHRKVFELLGSETMCPVVDEQLSGVGFSSTHKDQQVVVVSGGIPYAIEF